MKYNKEAYEILINKALTLWFEDGNQGEYGESKISDIDWDCHISWAEHYQIYNDDTFDELLKNNTVGRITQDGKMRKILLIDGVKLIFPYIISNGKEIDMWECINLY